jgi:NDP-sugar pyrophosphorylase family protein
MYVVSEREDAYRKGAGCGLRRGYPSMLYCRSGYQKENLVSFLGDQYKDVTIEYIFNDIYNKTNNIYSLYLAKDYLVRDDTVLLESDLIFEDTLLSDIVSSPEPNVAAVAKWEAWMDGTVVQLSGENEIAAFIPKKAFSFEPSDHIKTHFFPMLPLLFSGLSPFWRSVYPLTC